MDWVGNGQETQFRTEDYFDLARETKYFGTDILFWNYRYIYLYFYYLCKYEFINFYVNKHKI